jgi:hypothetical protein
MRPGSIDAPRTEKTGSLSDFPVVPQHKKGYNTPEPRGTRSRVTSLAGKKAIDMYSGRIGNAAISALVALVISASGSRASVWRAEPPSDGGCLGAAGVPGPGPVPPAPHSGFAQLFPRPSPPAVVQPVLCQHDPAPGLPDGFAIYDLGGQQIDAAGNILILGVLEGPDVTAANVLIDYYATADGPQVLFWQSQPAPELGPDVIIADLLPGFECLAQDGTVAAIPQVSAPGIVPGYNDYVLYVGYPPDLHKVLQTGDQAPGCEAGVYIDGSAFAYFRCYLSNNGTLRVEAKLAGPGVTDLNDSAVWVGTPDNLVLAYRKGMQAPGCPVGVALAGAASFAHNDLGDVNFAGSLRGSGVTSGNDTGHWGGALNELGLVAREGDQVLGMPVGVTWKTPATGACETNAWGDIVQEGYIQGPGVTADNDGVLYLSGAEGLVLAGREGDPAPQASPGVTIAAIGNTLINDRHEALYRVKFAGTAISASNQWATYFGLCGAAQLALRDADPAPTLQRGTTVWRAVAVPQLAAMNGLGDIVAPTQVQGPGVTDADKVVLWMRHHVLQRWVPLLRSGIEIDGRTLYAEDETAFPCGATGGSDGRHRRLNDSGELALRLDFTDGTHGVFRISFPFGDGNHDGQVDLADFSLMQFCWSNPERGSGGDGAVFDMDADGDVDLADMAMFQQLYSGG